MSHTNYFDDKQYIAGKFCQYLKNYTTKRCGMAWQWKVYKRSYIRETLSSRKDNFAEYLLIFHICRYVTWLRVLFLLLSIYFQCYCDEKCEIFTSQRANKVKAASQLLLIRSVSFHIDSIPTFLGFKLFKNNLNHLNLHFSINKFQFSG